MKKLLAISILFVIFTQCKKKDNSPQPEAKVQTTQSTSSLSTQEQDLIGTWIMDSTAYYNGNTRISVTVSSSSLTCKTEFYSSFWSNSTEWKNVNTGHQNCTLLSMNWKAPNTGYVNIGGVQYGIMLITPTQLIFTGNNLRYYFHQ